MTNLLPACRVHQVGVSHCSQHSPAVLGPAGISQGKWQALAFPKPHMLHNNSMLDSRRHFCMVTNWFVCQTEVSNVCF